MSSILSCLIVSNAARMSILTKNKRGLDISLGTSCTAYILPCRSDNSCFSCRMGLKISLVPSREDPSLSF